MEKLRHREYSAKASLEEVEESRLFPESTAVSASRKFGPRVNRNLGFHYVSRFKSPAKGFVSQRGLAPVSPFTRPVGPSPGFGKGLCISPAARGQSACEPLINFRGCRSAGQLCPRPRVALATGRCGTGVPRQHPARFGPGPQPGRASPGAAGRGGPGGGASLAGRRPRPALGQPRCSGRDWRGRGLGRGRAPLLVP